MSNVVISDTLSLPAEQAIYIGNYSILYEHEGRLYVKSYDIIYNFSIILYIGGNMYMKMRYKKAEMYMRVAKHREERIQKFIMDWSHKHVP